MKRFLRRLSWTTFIALIQYGPAGKSKAVSIAAAGLCVVLIALIAIDASQSRETFLGLFKPLKLLHF